MASRRDRIEAALRGGIADRPPVAFWRHWPGDDVRAESHAEVELAFRRDYDWDFVKVTVEAPTFHLLDWGFRSRVTEKRLLVGGRDVVAGPVTGPEDWKRLRPLDVTAGAHGENLRCLRLVARELRDDVPFLFTAFQPSVIADRVVGRDQIALMARRYPNELKALLEVITDTVLAFVREGMRTGAAGLFFATGTCGYGIWSEAEYREFSLAYDLRILDEAVRLGWFNMVHLCGMLPMFPVALDYPVRCFNWDDRVTPPTLAAARSAAPDLTLVGGLERMNVLLNGSAEDVTRQALDAFAAVGGKGFMLGAGCTIPPHTSRTNLRAARRAVEMMAG